MRIPFPYLLIATIFLAGCGSSSWFGRDAPDEDLIEPIEADNPLIPETTAGLFRRDPDDIPGYQGTTVDAISDLIIEQVPGGIIIRATGRTATQGAFNARLTPRNADELPEDGVLTYFLQAESQLIVGGAPVTREVTVGRKLTDQEITGVRTIRVEGVQNALERRP